MLDNGGLLVILLPMTCRSVAKSYPALWDPMSCSTPCFPVLHCILKFAQTHPLSQWCRPTISSSDVRFSSCPQSFPALGFFQWVGSSQKVANYLGASVSAQVLPMNSHGWFPFRLTGFISLLSKGLSRVFSSITIWKHKFLGAQLSLWSNSPICTWLLETA